MTRNSVDLEDEMEVVARRVEFIDLLDEAGPLEPRDIVDALDHSRSTVTRGLRALRDADLIEKTANGYVVTLPAVMAADEYRRYETTSEAILTSKELLAPIPESQGPPVDLLIGSDTILAETDIPIRPLEAVSDRVRDADTVQAYLPTLVNTHLLRVWHRAVVLEAVDGTAVFDPDLLTVLKGQYPQILAEMAAMRGFSAFATTGPPYGVVLTTTSDTTTVSVIVYENDTAVRGVVTNESVAAVEWARNEFERLRCQAVEVTADLDALSAAVTDGMHDLPPAGRGQRPPDRSDRVADAAGYALPLALEAEGFVRLSSDYFDAHGEASPAVSWRTGFTLAEVRAGHPVDRLDDDGRNLTEKLLERLCAGDDHVLLGPPGSGKSTICMKIACEWYEQGLGPVLYRERGSGDHFKSVALLEAYLRQTEEHTLVVVEDAVREQAAAIFDVMQTIDDYQHVTFLLDARTHEWQNADALAIDARRDAYRLTAIDQVRVPDLNERECTRFVTHFTDLVGADLTLSGGELFSMVETGKTANEGDRVSTGDVLVAQHYLSQRYDPFGGADEQPQTVLDEAVRSTYQTLIDAETRFALELAVLINLLNAAGIPVAVEYLYSLTTPDEYAELDEAIALLEGHLLFEQDPPGVRASTIYRTRHETWASRFLEQFLDLVPTQRARNQFGHCVTRLLALADEAEQRQQIQQHFGGRTPHLHQIEADPGNWADEAAARVFRIGRTNASLAPLFSETTTDTIELPAACTAWTTVQQAYWRGEMNRLYGDLERAEREFHTLREWSESVDLSNEQDLKPAMSDVTSRHYVSNVWEPRDREAQRKHWRATSLSKLGRIAETRGELETAAGFHEDGFALFSELGDRQGEAYALNDLGIVARQRGELEAAVEYHEEGLALFREIGNRHGEAYALGTLGMAVCQRGELETADEYLEESLTLYRKIGNRRGEAWALDNRGTVARQRREWETAEEYLEESLSSFRELGDRRGEARALNNLGAAVCQRGELETAVEYLEESLTFYRKIGNRRGEADVLNNLGSVAQNREQLEEARSRFEEAAGILVTIGAEGAATPLTNVIDTCDQQGDIDAARDWCRRAIDFAEQTDRKELYVTFSNRHADLPDTDGVSSGNS